VILGIESTCDDSAVAAVSSSGKVLFNLVSSQWDLHAQHGGVMPSMAARAHEQNLPLLIQDATKRLAALNLTPHHVVVSSGPGLAPCLRVGMNTAVDAAKQFGVPLSGVNHLEAHVLSPRTTESCEFPYLALLVSGGHCMLVVVRGVGKYETLGTTLDDSVGEAYDKVARMLGCVASDGRHPGAHLEEIAARGTPANVPLKRSLVVSWLQRIRIPINYMVNRNQEMA
jgi:N6-L-threonylcarbamoyladenine synthase